VATIQRLNTYDIRNALSHIREKEAAVLQRCLEHEIKSSMNSEIALIMAASDCEIEMSNFCAMLREKMTSGVVS
jgi:hypothetical protein